MTTRRGAGLLLAAALLFPAGRAAASQVVEDLLLTAASPVELRARLLAFAATAPESAAAAKGAAWYYLGLSFDRAGHADSALACYERAVALRGAATETDAYVDALLRRGRPDDAARAQELLGPRLQEALTTSVRDMADTRGRIAWAMYTAGRGDSALVAMRLSERSLLDPLGPHHRDWRYRLGLLELEHGDVRRCVELLLPLALESRFQDRDVMDILGDAAQRGPASGGLPTWLRQEAAARDREEEAVLQALGARRVTFTAGDGSTLAAIVFAAPARRPARSAVAILAPDETFEAYDSLAVGLARAGYALLVLEPPGSGWSVAPTCPLPETWRGRENELQNRVARDLPSALRALAAAAAVDTSRYLLIASGQATTIAVEAATLDRRARSLLLMSPRPSPVDRGPMRARLHQLGVPVFLEIPVQDHVTLPLAEALYQAIDPRASRIAESEWIGSGPRVFRRDRSALPRLIQWLDESWRAPGGRGPRR